MSFKHDLFADHLIGDKIAVAVIGDLAVLVNFAKHLDRRVIVSGRQRTKR